jgi:hypothetical protein
MNRKGCGTRPSNKILSQKIFSEGTEENHRKSQEGQLVCWPTFRQSRQGYKTTGSHSKDSLYADRHPNTAHEGYKTTGSHSKESRCAADTQTVHLLDTKPEAASIKTVGVPADMPSVHVKDENLRYHLIYISKPMCVVCVIFSSSMVLCPIFGPRSPRYSFSNFPLLCCRIA